MKPLRFHAGQIRILFAFVMLLLSAGTGWAQSSPSDTPGGDAGPVNAMCPVMPDEPIDPRFTVIYEGKAIGLCCRKCRTKFEADPVAYIANLTASLQTSPGVGDHDDQPEQTDQLHATDKDHTHDHDATASSNVDAVDEARGGANTGETTEHTHTHDTDSRARLIVWMGKFHPASTHLPIGLILGAAIAEALFILTRKAHLRHAAAFCLTIGTIGAVLTATLGWFNGGFVLWDDDWVQATHRWLGTSTALGAAVALLFLTMALRHSESHAMVRAYRTTLVCLAALIAATGFFGGSLVYGLTHYSF